MKIAIASEEKNPKGTVSDRAGRATFYLIFDEQKALLETVKNPFSIGGGGAGFSVAKMLADKQVHTVIAEKFGPKMSVALEERGVSFIPFSGSITDALNAALQ
ncbi:hypothetical protein GF369_02950 [Candidatus Peregrinibacteria bacterium]|nr:hypothetical protein [Candidatus Peregrinibacteria bacterium]